MDCAIEFTCAASTVGLVLPFILVDPPVPPATEGLPISNAESATVVWLSQSGQRRPLQLSYAESATFTYTLSMGDTRIPHSESGVLQVTFGTGVFFTSAFQFVVAPHF